MQFLVVSNAVRYFIKRMWVQVDPDRIHLALDFTGRPLVVNTAIALAVISSLKGKSGMTVRFRWSMTELRFYSVEFSVIN